MRALACVLLLTTTSAADDKPKLAVLGVMATDHGLAKSADAMTAQIRTLAGAKASNYRVTGTPKQISSAVLAAECSSIQPTCAAQLGATLEASYVVAGELERRGSHQILTLVLVDVRTKQRIRSVRETFGPKTHHGTIKADAKKLARTAYGRLVDGEAGELALAANAQQGEIWIDGELVGALFEGRATITGLVNGTHQLTVRAKGYKPLDVDITIEFATKQAILLDPE